MKTTQVLKSIFAAGFLVAATVSASAQVTSSGAVTDLATSDTVTVGSVMPYRVAGDPNMHLLRSSGILGFSQFTKTVTGGTMRNLSGVAASTPAATDSAISVNWTAVGNSFSVAFTEAPQAGSGPAPSCVANTQTLAVVVVDRPKAVWGSAPTPSGCSVAGTTVTIPYSLTGTGQFKVTYKITYTPLSGLASDIVPTNTITVGGNGTGTSAFNITYGVPAATYGKYEVFISNVSDRISEKSFGPTYAATPVTELPATAATFYSYPAPATQPIQHVKNL